MPNCNYQYSCPNFKDQTLKKNIKLIGKSQVDQFTNCLRNMTL